VLKKNNNRKNSKGKPLPDLDGRADAAACDEGHFADFRGTTKPKKSLASVVTSSTTISHQSGVGTRGERQDIMGIAKTAVIRWFAASGCDQDRCRRFFAATPGLVMTAGVWAKNWARGMSGEGVPDIPREIAAKLRSLVK